MKKLEPAEQRAAFNRSLKVPRKLVSEPPRARVQQQQPLALYAVGDTIRMKQYPTSGGFRVWKVIGVHLGATHQEGTYALKPLDVSEHQSIHIPCLILETHSGVEKV